MRSLTTSAAVVLSVVALACGSSSPASSVISPSAAAPTALKITGAVNSRIVIGDTAQFSAMATMGNGATVDVTGAATWSTSDPSIFAVGPGGRVTGLKVGSADIRAAYQGATDKDYTTVQPFLTFVAYGTVSAAPPDFGGLSGVRVEITPGPTGTLSTTTGASGDYSFTPLKGGNYTITVTRDGFHAQSKTITATRDVRTDFPLIPVPPAGATARCKDKSWSYATNKAAACAANSGVSYWACPGPFCGS